MAFRTPERSPLENPGQMAPDFAAPGPEVGDDHAWEGFQRRCTEWARHIGRTAETGEEVLAHLVHEFGLVV